ncbi:FxSxx-COOH system tetratricopeptide repeat protein [Amycolatopsis pigmentata]|uniref:FxSxx-COOH system tetratricopeptide repeat protein n=1 Tax=Amycolatopsis pigmentata TaxID=450801 RepID=A0ABW5FXS8_9PSEU
MEPGKTEGTTNDPGTLNSVVGKMTGVQARSTGDVTFNFGVQPEVEWPHRTGVVPTRAGCFQDRALTATLAQAVAESDTVVLTALEPASTQVLSGLGGVGKTQLAANFAEKAWEAGEIDLLVWVAAGSRDAIVSTYARAATELGRHHDSDDEQGAQRFLAALAGTRKRWLVVLDDVRNPGDTRELWPPHTATGRTIATTRRRDAAMAGDRRRVIDVGVFATEESLSYLNAKLEDHPHLKVGAAELADTLGHLPLALAQAAAYLIDEDLTCTRYRELFADKRRRLAELLPEPTALPDDHATTVAATWSLSIEAADKMRPVGLASHVLNLAAVLDPNGIPASLFTAPSAVAYLAKVSSRETDADEVRSALRCLHRLNLATVHTHLRHQEVRVHALVQRAAREQLTDTALGPVARAAAAALMDIWPLVERDNELVQVLRANANTLHATVDRHLWEPGAHRVLFRIGESLGQSGQVNAARSHFESLHDISAESLGPHHPDTLVARGEITHWRGKAGDITGAITELERLLTDCRRILGPDHSHTLAARNNLAYWRAEAGDITGAATELEQLLTDHRRILGPDHPDTLAARNNLAHWRGQAGDITGAITEFEQLLTDCERILGPDHPDTLAARNGLASCRLQGGDITGAATELEQLLTDRQRILGPDHPDTLITRNNLAALRGTTGDIAGAITEFEQLLTERRRILGPDHPDTLVARNNLAAWRAEAGDLTRATTELEQLVADRRRVLGPDHPDTLLTRNNLADCRGRAGDIAGAIAEFQQLLTDLVRVLGPDHPSTRVTRNNLTYLREAADPDPR